MIISERDAHILQKMTQHCDEIYETLQYFGVTKEEFLGNSICHGAACMEFQLVGEGIKLLSRNILGNGPEVPWNRIQEMGDFIGTQYYNADFEKIWDRIHEDIPVLREYCANLLKENNYEIIRVSPIPRK